MSRAVIDQPASRVLTIGLLIAVVFGLIIRWQISDQNVQKYLDKTVQRLEKDFIVDFESAHVHLSQWGMPLPHLKIENVRLSPKKNNCQSSQIYIDELDLPISILGLIFSRQPVDSLRAHDVQVRVAQLESCFAQSISQTSAVTRTEKSFSFEKNLIKSKSADKAADLTVLNDVFQKKTKSDLKEIYIEQLKIVTLQKPEQPVVLKQVYFDLDYQSFSLSQVNIRAQIFALKDSKKDIYFLVGDFTSTFKSNDQQNIEVSTNLKGRMLDGEFELFAYAQTLTKKMMYELKTHKVSLKAFAPIIESQDYDLILEKWPLASSFHLFGEVGWGAESKLFSIKMKDFEIQGENTLLTVPSLDLAKKNDHLVLGESELNIQKLPLKYLKNYPALSSLMQSIDNPGDLSGRLVYENANHWTLSGELKNTDFIFSNRGSRELQRINLVKVFVEQENQNSHLELTHFFVNDQEIKGFLQADYERERHLFQGQLDLEGPLLNEKVWKQLTDIKQKPEMKVSWNFKKAAEERHTLKLYIPQVNFQGFELRETQVDFIQSVEDENQSLALALKTNEAHLEISKIKDGPVQTLFKDSELGLAQDVYWAHKLSLTLNGESWKKMNFEFDTHLRASEDSALNVDERLKSKGDWENDRFSGYLTVQNRQRQVKFNINKNLKDELIFEKTQP